jgi:nicotinamidase-related amidase
MDANRTRSRSVSIGAKPGPVTIDLAMTAALVVDMQNDFSAKGGMFERAGIDISVTRAAIGPTARALAAIRQASVQRWVSALISPTSARPTPRTGSSIYPWSERQ